MEWPIIVALCIGIPFLILPAGFAWFVLVSSLTRSWKDARHRTARTTRRSPIDKVVRGFTLE
jgi:hypothetical protein